MSGAPEHRKRSILATITIPMLILVVVELLLFMGALLGSGVFDRLSQSNYDVLDAQVSNRRDTLQSYFVGTVSNMRDLSAAVDGAAAQVMGDEKGDVLSVANDQEKSAEVLRQVVDPMISALRAKRVSGVFVILGNTSAPQDGGASKRLQGVYIRDHDPAATPSARNEDLSMVRAPVDVVQAHGITTAISWQPTFTVDEEKPASQNYYFKPLRAAADALSINDPQDYLYWGAAPDIETGKTNMITCSVPLVYDDGTVYGVVGVDLSEGYMESLLPSQNLYHGKEGSYVLAQFYQDDLSAPLPENLGVHPMVGSGRLHGPFAANDVYTLESGARELHCAVDQEEYCASRAVLRLYSTNAPFDHERWMLVGMVPHDAFHGFINQLIWSIALAALLMLAAGIIGAIVAGRSISNPVRNLSQDLMRAFEKRETVPNLRSVGIAEIDQLTSTINTLSVDMADTKRREQERIEHERDYDLLTGLMNRRSFYREAEKIFATPELLKSAAMLMLDLDDLKNINDVYGHDCGDKYIYQAACCFKEAVPNEALLSRVSGDEFYVLFFGYDSRKEIEEHVEHIRQALDKATFELPSGEVAPINASGGVALYLEDGREFAELMKLADFTMYQVKASGKNDIAYFDFETYQKQGEVLRGVAELNAMINDYSLVKYHFQPIFSTRTGEPYAYEALMRVEFESLKSPMDVMTFARQERKLDKIEHLTWVRTFECFSALRDRGKVDKNAYLFINSFAHLSLPEEELRRIAAEYPELIGNVVIEITEAEDMDEQATMIKRDTPGFSGFFALDDYGSGYNSELRLIDLRPKFVKVDISIIRNIDTSVDKQRIVTHVVEYAHERDMMVIAEGVETADELDQLMQLDVDLVQGYYVAEPAEEPASINPDALKQIRARKN